MRSIYTQYPLFFKVGIFLSLTFFDTSPSLSFQLSGRLRDGDMPVTHAQIFLSSEISKNSPLIIQSDSTGYFQVHLPKPGMWDITVKALGYQPLKISEFITSDTDPIDVLLEPLPLIIDELFVRSSRSKKNANWAESILLDSTVKMDLVQTLDYTSGVNVHRYGGIGSFSTVSIRGSTSEQVQVFLDGVPLNNANGGGVDLSSISMAGIESIDIYRGFVPAQLDGNSIGGVLHLKTRRLQTASRTRLKARLGSFGTAQFTTSLSSPWRTGSYLTLVEYSAIGNHFRYHDNNGTPYNTSDDSRTTRKNSDVKSLHVLAKADWSRHNKNIQFHSTFNLNQKGIPGLGVNPSLNARYNTWRHLVESSLSGTFSKGKHSYRLKTHSIIDDGIFKDVLGEVGIDLQHVHNRTHNFGLRGESSFLLHSDTLVNIFGSLRRLNFKPIDYLRTLRITPKSRRTATKIGTVWDIPLTHENFSLRLAGQREQRYDRLFSRGTIVSSTKRRLNKSLYNVQAGLSAYLPFEWKLRASIGSHQRAPSFFELFGDRGAIIGNSDLTDEKSRKHEIMLVYQAQTSTVNKIRFFEINLYYNRVNNLIRFIHNSQLVSRPYNIGSARIRGIETRWEIHIYKSLQFFGNYVYQYAENRSPFPHERGRYLPNTPRQRINGHVKTPIKNLQFSYDFNFESKHFLDRANLRSIPRRFIHDVHFKIFLSKSSSIVTEIRNISNNQVADLWGYPLPGRSLFFTFETKK